MKKRVLLWFLLTVMLMFTVTSCKPSDGGTVSLSSDMPQTSEITSSLTEEETKDLEENRVTEEITQESSLDTATDTETSFGKPHLIR